MKTKRNLSGIFFRFKNPETGKVENRCFEDLPEEEQDRILSSESKDNCIRMAKMLSNILNEIGEAFNIEKQ